VGVIKSVRTLVRRIRQLKREREGWERAMREYELDAEDHRQKEGRWEEERYYLENDLQRTREAYEYCRGLLLQHNIDPNTGRKLYQ
jgi:hypothetical protein